MDESKNEVETEEVETEEAEVEEVDIEKAYSKTQTAAKLRRLAEALEQNKPFEIQLDGKKITIPVEAKIEFEYEESDGEKELEIEISWK